MRYGDLVNYPPGWLATLTHEEIGRYAFPLVTDRGKPDGEHLRALLAKGWQKLTEAEQREYLAACMRGAYNTSDLNRVGMALHFVAEQLAEWGYAVQICARTDWQKEELIYAADLQSYLADVERLRSRLAAYQTTPETPAKIRNYAEANAVEQIICDVYELLQKMIAGLFYAGEIYAGEV